MTFQNMLPVLECPTPVAHFVALNAIMLMCLSIVAGTVLMILRRAVNARQNSLGKMNSEISFIDFGDFMRNVIVMNGNSGIDSKNLQVCEEFSLGWETWRVDGKVHLVPTNDLMEHELLEKCWCNPEVEENGKMISHHSLDCRELYESKPLRMN